MYIYQTSISASKLQHKHGQTNLPMFPPHNLGPTLPKVISNVFKVNLIITLGLGSFIAIMPKLSK